ncbi:MAG TPA: VOC family protein [Candidatus Dormibacteraeota bacterium]|nr:VOC family protein [Candidatus Dormibacteraeota bacterium]
MITRLDHLAIAFPDLKAAVSEYRELGFEVQEGGSHRGLGTHNAIVRFGLDYLELIAVRDEAEALAAGEAGRVAVDFVRKAGRGLLGFAVATADAARDADRLAQCGVPTRVVAMERRRPDGRTLKWRLAIPEGGPWRHALPFLIEWETPDEERLAWERPGRHRNGALGLAGVSIVVRDLERTAALYRDALGFGSDAPEESAGPSGHGRRFSLAGTDIRLFSPGDSGEAATTLASVGEGPFEFALRMREARG